MADISQYLQAIMSAVYGEDVRGSIHDAIDIINQVSEVVFNVGTAVTGPTSSSTGFFEDSIYLNTNTWDVWKCIGEDSWDLLGNIEGAPGNKWYRGINISGKSPTAQVYPTGIAEANPNDFYLNPQEGAIYYCVSGGGPTVATWAYDFTMTGGGGGVSQLEDLTDVDITTPSDGESLVYDGSHAKWKNKKTIDALARALQNEFGVHNLMPFAPYSDLTSHNITPTIRPNGTVRYNTSAAIDANTTLGISAPTSATTNSSTKYVLKAGSYKFVVKTSSALSVDMYVAVQNCDNDTAIAVANSGTEAVVPFTLSADTSILVYSYFAAGQTLSNFDVQAFIILDSDTDTDYLPFALPNSKLTEAVYKNKISDANTDNNDGMLRYYHVIGVSGNHAPQNGSAYLMLEFGYAEKFVIQLAFDVSNDYIYMRRKGNNASWSTVEPYGWKQIYPALKYKDFAFYSNAQTGSGQVGDMNFTAGTPGTRGSQVYFPLSDVGITSSNVTSIVIEYVNQSSDWFAEPLLYSGRVYLNVYRAKTEPMNYNNTQLAVVRVWYYE